MNWSLNSEKKRVFFLWLRVFLWCTVISIFSSIPNEKGKQPNFESLVGILDFCLRKGAHLFEFSLLMILVYKATEKSWKNLLQWHFLISFFFTIGFSIFDEWHQTFTFGRTGTLLDVFIDSVGSLMGYGFVKQDIQNKVKRSENL